MVQHGNFKYVNEEEIFSEQIKTANENVDELLKTNPSRQELAMYLCAMAEHSMFSINETHEWKLINEYEFFTVEEFEVDLTEVEKANAIGEMGQARWKYLGN